MSHNKIFSSALLICCFYQSIAKTNLPYDTIIKPSIVWDELNPRAIEFVKDYLPVHQERLMKMKTWGAPYFLIIEKILTRYQLPPSLKYLAVIESELKPIARSAAGAAGPWQLMPETAKELGLIVSTSIDERTDLTKSTHAAARFLFELYEKLGDWLLVVAAYNGGPARLDNIIKKNDKKNFWEIQKELPAESRNHVKKFIATHYIFEGQDIESLELQKNIQHTSNPVVERADFDSIKISGRYLSAAIAKVLELDMTNFNQWNPQFNDRVSTGYYTLRLPKNKIETFETQQDTILKMSIQLVLDEANKSLEAFPMPQYTDKPEKTAEKYKKNKKGEP